jgi:putative ATP-dependent endonuclease of OLD family
MHISRLVIKNYRNYQDIDLPMHRQNIIVGANKVGKSNLISAIRLAIDPNLRPQSRKLTAADFWDGGGPFDGRHIIVVVEFQLESAEERDEMIKMKAIVEGSIEETNNSPDEESSEITDSEETQVEVFGIARFTYEFFPRQDDENEIEGLLSDAPDETEEETENGGENSEVDIADEEDKAGITTYHPSQYKHIWYSSVGYEASMKEKLNHEISSDRLSYRIMMLTLRALRDTEDLLSSWTQSPLRSLLEGLGLDRKLLGDVATQINKEAAKVAADDVVDRLMKEIDNRSSRMVGDIFSVGSTLNAITDDPDDLLKALQLFIDRDRPKPRPISHASLGTLNVLYLVLLLEDMYRNKLKSQQQTILALEEPEAHVHPHVQRSLFRYFIEAGEEEKTNSLIVTTHSPHIVSVSPISDIIVLRDQDKAGTKPYFVNTQDFSEAELLDLQRYLDVNRGELIFARSVILVEGTTEKFLLPVFAQSMGIDFDHLGISVISVEGVDFLPYIKLVSARNLNIPFAVLTDSDETRESKENQEAPDQEDEEVTIYTPGLTRANKLVAIVDPSASVPLDHRQLERRGFFLGQASTLEVELIRSCPDEMCVAYDGLVAKQTTRDKFREAIDNAKLELATGAEGTGVATVLKRIKETGKGRYAQRLSAILKEKNDVALCPEYVQRCLRYAEALSLQVSGLVCLVKWDR